MTILRIPRDFLPNLALYVVILTEGFVTISLEILTLRQMIPFVGNSVTVTSLIIGVFLLFLAYGYRQGGKINDNPIKILTRNFCIAAILLGIGLSYPFIALYFMAFNKLFSANLFSGLLVYLLFITAPLVYLLGQTVPITMHLHKKHENVGLIGGKVLHASTIGSFLGSILTTVVLMHFVGVAQTVVFNYCLLLFLVVLLNINQLQLIYIVILTGFSIIVFQCNVQFERLTFIKTNSFANYAVEDARVLYGKPSKALILNRSGASYIDDEMKGFPYIELVKRILFEELAFKHKDILVLGAGGFTLSAENTYENYFKYVDIDPELPKIIKNHFLEKIEGEIVIQDARQFLLTHPKKYDAIVSDTYSHRLSVPTHLATKEYFQLIATSIKPEGYALFNIVANPLLKDAYSKRMDNTIRSVFNSCMVIPLEYKNARNNLIYVCQNNKKDEIIYIDNNNQIDFDLYQPE